MYSTSPPSTHTKRPGHGILMLAVCAVPALFPRVNGDIVQMVDGRQYEGKIVESDDRMVRIDAMVAGVRVKIGLPRRDIDAIVEKELPEDFYDPPPETPKGAPDPKSSETGSNLYLEVPIVGRFGIQVVPEGIRKCLSYAVANRIEHIVFFVDSQGGEQVAAREIYELLSRYDERIEYHALVRDSVGVAMAVTVWCDDVFMLPGANLGGTELVFEKDRYEGDPEVFLSQVAYEVDQVAAKRGWPVGLAAAMIDPEARFAAWADDSGQITTGVRVPGSVPRNRVIVSDRRQSVLTLSRDQAAALGVAREFNRGAEALGSELGVEAWKRKSDYGQTAVFDAARARRDRMQRVASRDAEKIKKLVKRQNTTRRYIERCLTLAHKWDPGQKPYSTYRDHRSTWERYWTGDPLTGTTTRRRWRELTDTTLGYLQRARKGVIEMRKLDEQAERLGIEREYKPEELDDLLDDIVVKIEFLARQRNLRAGAT